MMKLLIVIAWCASITWIGAQVDGLTEQERESLLKRLRVIREASDSRVEARFRGAVQAYRAAMLSDEATIELYLSCVEKIDFTDQDRRASDFREWRRKNEDRLKDKAFRRALRHQLRWLVLTLQASSESAERQQLAASAQEVMDSIVNDAANLTGHQNILDQSVGGSVFARAYDIGKLEADDWVMAPGRIGLVYDQIILPIHRHSGQVEKLRSSWNNRIQQEIRIAEAWRVGQPRGHRIGPTPGKLGADHEKFMIEEIPPLQWKMEIDLFKHGDAAAAASRMLALLERNAAHSSMNEWSREIEELLMAGSALGESPESESQAQPELAPSPPTTLKLPTTESSAPDSILIE